MARPPKPLRLRFRKDTQKYEIVGPHPDTGVTVREQTGTGNLEKAQDYLARYLAGVDASNGKPKRHDPDLRDLLDAYQGMKEKKVASKGTLVQNLNHLRRHLGGVKPWQISDQTLERYLKLRQKDTYTIPHTKITKTGAADSTVRRELSTLSQALKWAKRERETEWFMGKGYHDDFRYPVKSKATRRHKWLKKEQARKIADAAEPHCRLFIELALAAAARHSAILELTWDMVDLETGEIDFGEAIGNKDRPATTVSERVLQLLREAHEIRCTDRVIEYGGKTLKSIDTAFKKAVIRAGFVAATYSNGQKKAAYSVHVLKHTSITWMVHARMSYDRIGQLTCTSPEVIRKHYGHHDPSITEEAQAATDF